MLRHQICTDATECGSYCASDISRLLDKTAGITGALAGAAAVVKNVGTIAAPILMAGYAARETINKISNDTRRKAIIEDLAANDPQLKNVDKGQLLEWYATLYNFAPKISLDKNTVREVLQNFVRFGRADIQTLKMLADTEKSVNDNRNSLIGTTKSITDAWEPLIN